MQINVSAVSLVERKAEASVKEAINDRQTAQPEPVEIVDNSSDIEIDFEKLNF
jgi:hypothetical protein